MDLSLPVINLKSIYPQIILVLFASIVVIWPLFVKNVKREVLAFTSILGVVLAFISVLILW